MLEHTFDEQTNTLVFSFSGHMDSPHSQAVAPEVESQLQQHKAAAAARDKPLKVVFNLKDVAFISSAFIRICLTAAATLKAGNLSVQNASPLIKKTLKISGLEKGLRVS